MAIPARRPRIRRGQRLYAIGDIHGRLDLFAELLARIKEDAATRKRRHTRIILIGDLTDYGPQSAELITHIHALAQRTERLIVLRGDHEQMMLRAMAGNLSALDLWLDSGGSAALASWGIPHDVIHGAPEELLRTARAHIPFELLQWVRSLPLSYKSGDFYFVHAGIRPGVRLNAQHPVDLLEIDDAFLESDAVHPAIIVHGHSICEDGPEILPNRIALDTGAYRTRRLSAVGFETDSQWVLTT